MLDQPAQQAHPSAHVVVLGNEKGGSGKSTTALHIAVALLKAGQRVATIDLDGRQKTFTHYIENRRAWAARPGIQLELWAERAGNQLDLPTHYCVERAESSSIEANEMTEVANFSAAVSAIERSYDFLVIDTPGNDTFLMRLAHSMATRSSRRLTTASSTLTCLPPWTRSISLSLAKAITRRWCARRAASAG